MEPLRAKDTGELKAILKGLEIEDQRAQHIVHRNVSNRVVGTSPKEIRRTIARVKTILNERGEDSDNVFVEDMV